MFAKTSSSSQDSRWLTLDAGATLRLRDAQGLWVEVAAAPGRGGPQPARLWLTEEHGPDDVFLHAGERHRLTRAGRTLLTAWAPLRVRVGVEPEAVTRAVPGPRPGGTDVPGGCCPA